MTEVYDSKLLKTQKTIAVSVISSFAVFLGPSILQVMGSVG